MATFPIDHIASRVAGGTTALENLALACPHCNAHKWAAAEELDPDTGLAVRLFHPRQDVWDEHFEWTGNGVLTGRTSIGRATMNGLRMNAPEMIELRVLLAELGLFPEARG